MSRQEFQTLVGKVADAVAGLPVDADLEALLNQKFPASGAEIHRQINSRKSRVSNQGGQ